MMREKRDGWQCRKGRPTPLKRQSSSMSLISLAGKVRLRLRSAPLTTICHSTSFPFTPSPASPHLSSLLCWGQLSFNLAADGPDEVDGGELDCRQAGCVGHAGGGGKTLLEANPWGCSVHGALLLCLCLSWQEKR